MTRKLTLPLASALAISLAAGAVFAQMPGEAKRGPGPRLPAFETLDTNTDGAVTLEELNAKRLERLRAMDPDGDGVITLEEMKTEAGERARLRAEAVAEARFKALDIDGDGKLSAAEALSGANARPQPNFARLLERADADGNGALSKEEFDQASERMDRQRHGRQGERGERGDRGERGGRDHHDHHGKPDERGPRGGHDQKRGEGTAPAEAAPAPAQN